MINKLFALATLALLSFISYAQTTRELERRKVVLPNGWGLTPAGYNIPLGDLPLNLIISNNKNYAAVTNNGQSTQSIELIDLRSKKVLDTKIIAKSWYGLAFSKDDKFIYVSGGHDNQVNRYIIRNKKLHLKDSFQLGPAWPNRIGVAGLQVDDLKYQKLYVATRDDSSLYIFDLKTKEITGKIHMGAELYTCLLSPDRKRLYLSIWGSSRVAVLDVKKRTITGLIDVGSHPNEMCLSKNGNYLYVANANDNSVSVINTVTQKVIETLNTALYPGAPAGSTTNGVALSADDKTLYVVNADNNCLAVFDVSRPSESVSKGFIPVGWYPTNIKVVGKQILVTNGKGLSSFANPLGPNPTGQRQGVLRHAGDTSKPAAVQYIGGLFKGTLSFIVEPTPQQQSVYSQAVYKNTPYSKNIELNAQGEPGNPIPMKVGDKSPIKYVFYVIKENRTYDQVLSDVAGGNGDTSLLLFGEKITPNQHKIVKEFVLLDNFYVNAEVTADGHNWSMGAYANDFVEKSWPSNYSGRGGLFPGEGYHKMGNNKDGFIWHNAARNNVTYRTYAEFANSGFDVLKGHIARYQGWNSNFRDTSRFYQWKKDFDSLVDAHAVPQLTTIHFPNDHTEGMRAGAYTPYAHVADNDMAVGMFVDHISKSPIWKESAIFILEDDAQNGPDHVDAHRSTAYLISPYVKRRYIDHTMYSTASVLRTIELILGLPPMSQYDAAATPMWRCFTNQPDFTPFNYVSANVNLNERNPSNTPLAILSEKFDWSKEDAVPDLTFNEILWQGIKGTPAPAPVRSAFLNVKQDKNKDD